MSMTKVGQRGPVDHERREQILTAAEEHFRHYGYKKTTVADLAKAIGFSTAYVYKFFGSKQAIGEAICSTCLAKISKELGDIAATKKPAGDRLRRMFRSLAQRGADLFFHDRKMHNLVAASTEERWNSATEHDAALAEIVRSMIVQGREAGEFERKTPLNETCRAIMLAMQPLRHPVLLEQILDTLDEDATLMANLVLRSLAP
jgi:AcrR family transcriptional regulator